MTIEESALSLTISVIAEYHKVHSPGRYTFLARLLLGVHFGKLPVKFRNSDRSKLI